MAKNICIFCSHYFPYLGGVERYTGHLAAALRARGDKVVIVTSNDMHLETYTRMDGIPVFRMPCFNLLKGRFPVSKPNGRFWKIHRKLMEIPFDLVIIQTRFYPHSLYGSWLGKKQGTKCIVIDHGTSHMTVGNPLLDKIGAWYEHGITWLLKKNCRDFYGVSQECCRWLTHFSIAPAGTLYNAVDIREAEVLMAAPVRDFRKEYGIDRSTIVVTYTGRLVKEKGIIQLMEAFEGMSGENAVLLIAGDGEEWDRVKQRETKQMIPLGRLSFEEVMALLAETDIYCLPTDYPEGFPTSVLEAAAAGCFIITTDRGGSRELIPDSGYGMIMDNNQPETIRRALQEVLRDPDRRRRAAERTKRRLLERFTWDKTADKIHRL